MSTWWTFGLVPFLFLIGIVARSYIAIWLFRKLLKTPALL